MSFVLSVRYIVFEHKPLFYRGTAATYYGKKVDEQHFSIVVDDIQDCNDGRYYGEKSKYDCQSHYYRSFDRHDVRPFCLASGYGRLRFNFSAFVNAVSYT